MKSAMIYVCEYCGYSDEDMTEIMKCEESCREIRQADIKFKRKNLITGIRCGICEYSAVKECSDECESNCPFSNEAEDIFFLQWLKDNNGCEVSRLIGDLANIINNKLTPEEVNAKWNTKNKEN